jgi:hypothetical protein
MQASVCPGGGEEQPSRSIHPQSQAFSQRLLVSRKGELTMPITKNRLRTLIKRGVGSCIYCGSNDIYSGRFNQENTLIECWMNTECDHCGKSWKEIYRLAKIRNTDDSLLAH